MCGRSKNNGIIPRGRRKRELELEGEEAGKGDYKKQRDKGRWR